MDISNTQMIYDTTYRKSLRQNPHSALAKYNNTQIDESVEIIVKTSRPKKYYFIIPFTDITQRDLNSIDAASIADKTGVSSVGSVGSASSASTVATITSTTSSASSAGSAGSVGSLGSVKT